MHLFRIRSVALLLLAGVLVRGAHAQEISAMGGTMGTGAVHGTSYAWELEYRHQVRDRFAWSASWINEGHTASHHRDGLALQAWGLAWADPDEFSLALGAGEYYFADTHFVSGNGYTNDHGWTPVFSLSATYYTDSPWLVRVTANHIDQANGLGTNSVVAGLGYRLGWTRPDEGNRPPRTRAGNTLTVLAGRTIVNSRSSEHATATLLEYRRSLGRYVDWTLSAIDEGDPKVMQREGAATQVWLVGNYLERRIGVGLGAGPYFVFQHKGPATPNAQPQPGTLLLLSPTLSYQFGSHWQARLTWNRAFSRDDSDADVIVLGLGYRWGGN